MAQFRAMSATKKETGAETHIPHRELAEQNRRSWNAATEAHNAHKETQAEFLAGGGSTLFPEELDLLGEVNGRDLLHLQCNAGQDSLCLARLGARVTGVDVSDTAIEAARELARVTGLAATFERADLFDWLEGAAREGRRWALAFSSYGCVSWLPDLDVWARGIAGVLRPGGRFVLVEFHPAALVFDEQGNPGWPYSSGGEPMVLEEGVGDYVADSGEGLTPSGYADGKGGEKRFHNPHRAYEFQWGLGEIVNALLGAGLRLERLEEYRYANGWKAFPGMKPLPGRRFAMPEGFPDLPLMFGLAAGRPGE